MRRYPFGFALLLTMALSGCGNGGTVLSGHGLLSYGNDEVVIRPFGRPEATISATGGLAIGGKDVPVTPPERQLLADYYNHAVALRNAGVQTGKAGAAIAGDAIGGAIKGALGGNTDAIDASLDAKTKKIEQQAQSLCAEVQALQATQQAVAEQLPAFQPYAVFNHDHDDDCESKYVSRD